MEIQKPRQIISRRNRPAKSPLSREIIVTTALDLLTRDGLSGLSLRKVAAELDTGPASLYVYIANLGELQALMLDRALGGVALPEQQEGNWRERLTAVLASYMQVLYSAPGLAQLALTIIASGPNALRIIEVLLDLLLEGGIEPTVAAWGVDLLTLHVAGVAAEQTLHRAHEDVLEPVAQAVASVSQEEFPRIHSLREELLSGGPARIGWGVDVLINGILHAPAIPDEAQADVKFLANLADQSSN